MLATFVIGLREGLEAALIVGIIAAFLRRNGRSLRPMVVGVVAAVLLSLGVGVGLHLLERSLPQAAQEALETVIGVVAVVFVTGMVLWMSKHSRGLKQQLEREASDALGAGSSSALAVMAFLAVLKEGFETAVFLLATFQASSNAALAATGALLGILVAVGLGIGIYRGGLRLNLGRFFSYTGGFLLLVAAGLVVSTLGTAHEAGWIDAGQQRTLDLAWLAPPGSVRGALFTGVLGIPPDPRLIQVIGWFCYLVPMALVMYWPRSHRPSDAAAVLIRFGIAGLLVVVAGGLALSVRAPGVASVGPAPLVDAVGQQVGTAQLSDGRLVMSIGSSSSTRALGSGTSVRHAGVPDAVQVSGTLDESVSGLPASLSLQALAQLNGGRIPVGVSASTAPGPYKATWHRSGEWQAWTVGGQVLDYEQSDLTAVTLTGGGLTTSRTLTVNGTVPGAASAVAEVRSAQVQAAETHVSAVSAAAASARAAAVEAHFWSRTVPAVLLVAAIIIGWMALRFRRSTRPDAHAESISTSTHAVSTHTGGVPPSTAPSHRNLNVA